MTIEKKATLKHDDEKGFILVDESGELIATAEVGDMDDDIDYELVEAQCEKLGYELAD